MLGHMLVFSKENCNIITGGGLTTIMYRIFFDNTAINSFSILYIFRGIAVLEICPEVNCYLCQTSFSCNNSFVTGGRRWE